MRQITDHILSPANDKLRILAQDGPGSGNANHLYKIYGFNSDSNPVDPFGPDYGQPAEHTTILFQNGPINEVGVNGVTQEALLAIVIDRLRSFQTSQFACRENAIALTKLEEAMHWLQQRTIRRIRAGVEGTHDVAPGEGK